MKTHTTTTLRLLVCEELNPAAKPMSAETASSWLNKLPCIVKELYNRMNRMVFSRLHSRLLKRHFRQIQAESISLMNVLSHYRTLTSGFTALQNATFQHLEDILLHIKTHHARFFNPDLCIPDSHYCTAILEIETGINPLIAALKSKNADKNLQSLIESCLADFIKAGSCSYYRLAYMKGLQQSLTALCRMGEKAVINELLKEHLVYHNLNTAAHAAYYKREIQQQLAEIFDVQQQQDLLYAYQKQFKNWQQQQSWSFSPKNKDIKTMLLAYIKAEIKYLDARLKNSLAAGGNPGASPASTAVHNYRISVTFSVDALAYFFRLLVKAGVIGHGPKTQLLLFVAKSFQTPGIGNASLSVKSLDNKYRQVVQQTANTVRVALKRMLKLLDEEFA